MDVASYAIELKDINKTLWKTIDIYRKAVSFCILVFDYEWNYLSQFKGINRNGAALDLIHSTSTNTAKYPEFDIEFHKFPSYLLKSVIATALGCVSSYRTNLSSWEKAKEEQKNSNNNIKVGQKPTLNMHPNKMPTFYKGACYKNENNFGSIKIKLFKNNDWVWATLNLKKTDVKSILKHQKQAKSISCPTIERKNKKWFIRFLFEYETKLNETPIDRQRILSVDLGINTDAVCSVMQSDGTILNRKFINFPSDKDHLNHTLNKIKKVQRRYGSGNNTSRLWREVNFKNSELASKIAKGITNTAIRNHCDVIVFEYLDTKGKKKGRYSQRIHLWKKNKIQDIVTLKAHLNGIRIRRVNAANTSKLAYDGSGEVKRGQEAGYPNNKLCKFSTGKAYNCDLSASYNIGARYYIKAKQTQNESIWSSIQAKVPECMSRTCCTYSTLLSINRVLSTSSVISS